MTKNPHNCLLCLVNGQLSLKTWYLNLGVIKHMTLKKKWFTLHTKISNLTMVYLGDDCMQNLVQSGSVLIKLKSNLITKVQEVLHVPRLFKNLLSIGKSTSKGMAFEFISDKCVISFPSQKINFECVKEGSLYLIGKGIIDIDDKLNFAHVYKMALEDIMKWHLWFGHYNIQTLKLMETKDVVHDTNVTMIQLPFCKSCLFNKQNELKFPTNGGQQAT